VIGCAVSYSKLYLFHIAVAILFGFDFLLVLKNNFKIKINQHPTRLHLFLYWMIFWYALSIVWSKNPESSAVYVFYIFLGLVITTTMARFGDGIDSLRKAFKILGVFFVIEICLSLLEVFTPFRLPVSPYSNYLSMFGRSLADVDFAINRNSTSMPTGFQWNPNNLATTMTMILPFFLLHKRKIVNYAGAISVIVLVLAAGSRGNILAICFLMFVYLYLLNGKRAAIWGTIIPAIGILLVALLWPSISNTNNENVKNIVDSFQALKTYLTSNEITLDSIGTRQTLIKRGMSELKESHGLGIGGGASKALGGVDVRGYVGAVPMHNFWIEVLVEAGAVFFITFVLWYLRILFNLLKIARNSKDSTLKYFASATCLSMCGFLIGAISTSSTVYFLPMWIMFGFAIMTINNYKRANLVVQT
jgi:teichuronic acid biosynthesis protein TuaE